MSMLSSLMFWSISDIHSDSFLCHPLPWIWVFWNTAVQCVCCLDGYKGNIYYKFCNAFLTLGSSLTGCRLHPGFKKIFCWDVHQSHMFHHPRKDWLISSLILLWEEKFHLVLMVLISVLSLNSCICFPEGWIGEKWYFFNQGPIIV